MPKLLLDNATELRVIFKVREGAGGDYWLVESNACGFAGQVPYYARA